MKGATISFSMGRTPDVFLRICREDRANVAAGGPAGAQLGGASDGRAAAVQLSSAHKRVRHPSQPAEIEGEKKRPRPPGRPVVPPVPGSFAAGKNATPPAADTRRRSPRVTPAEGDTAGGGAPLSGLATPVGGPQTYTRSSTGVLAGPARLAKNGGGHWIALGKAHIGEEVVAAMQQLISVHTWGDPATRPKDTPVLSCTQLVVKSHGGGRSGAQAEESETTAQVTVVTDALYTNHGDAQCPACRLSLTDHPKGEVFMQRMETGEAVRCHTDAKPPPVTGSCCESTLVLLLHAADRGGKLRITSRPDGTKPKNYSRDTEVLPLWSQGDAVWIDGELAAHSVDKVTLGTRISLLLGVTCPVVFER